MITPALTVAMFVWAEFHEIPLRSAADAAAPLLMVPVKLIVWVPPTATRTAEGEAVRDAKVAGAAVPVDLR
jgi:hypothetical protein